MAAAIAPPIIPNAPQQTVLRTVLNPNFAMDPTTPPPTNTPPPVNASLMQ